MFIPTRIYGQKDSRLMINGRSLTGFMDGTPFKVKLDGGEVEKTEGTDGPGLNISTPQGGTISFTMREDTPDYNYLLGLFELESEFTGTTFAVTFMSGAQIIIEMPRALIGLPGELSTGDKKMGGIEFKIIGDSVNAVAPSF